MKTAFGMGQHSLRFGAFRLQASPLALYRGQDRVELTSQPLRLLELLARNAGRTVTHADIREALWEGRTVSFSGSIHVAIRQIRAALGDEAGDPRFIETVPREGYRFVAPVETDGLPLLPLSLAGATVLAAALALMVALPGQGSVPLPPPVESETVRLGEYLLTQDEPGAALRALEAFEHAVAEDGESVAAFAGAARAALLSGDMDRAEAYSLQANARDPEHAGAIEVRGHVAMVRDRDWRAARADLMRALELAPDFAPAHHSLATLLILSGEADAALAHMAEARRLDPASTLIRADLGWMEYYAGRYAEAHASCEGAARLHPGRAEFRHCAVRAAAMLGNPDAARDHLRWLMEASGVEPGEVDAALADPDPIAVFDRWRHGRYSDPGRADPVPASLLAFTAAYAGAHGEALSHLEMAADEGDPAVMFAFVDPAFLSLRGEPGFEALREEFSPAGADSISITDRSGLPNAPTR